MAAWAESWLSYDTKPKHFDRFVCLSMNTLAEMTVPNGRNVDAKSVSVNSCGKWYMNRLAASGPSARRKGRDFCMEREKNGVLNSEKSNEMIMKLGECRDLSEAEVNYCLAILTKLY